MGPRSSARKAGLREIDVNRLRWVAPFIVGHLLIPRPLQLALGVPVGMFLARAMARSREGVARNLARVLGRPDAPPPLVWRTFYKYGLYLLDYIAFALGGRERTLDLFAGGRPASADRALEAALGRPGRGAILVSPHLGNWELGGALLARLGRPPHVFTARAGDAALRRYRERFRRRLGIRFVEVMSAEGGAAGLIQAAAVLRAGGIVALLADRRGAGRAVRVRFFGMDCLFPAGPAALALATGAPLIPTAIVLDRGLRYRALTGDPIEPRAPRRCDREARAAALEAATQAIATRFEGWIRAYPDQWFNFFDYFAEAAAPPAPATCAPCPQPTATAAS